MVRVPEAPSTQVGSEKLPACMSTGALRAQSPGRIHKVEPLSSLDSTTPIVKILEPYGGSTSLDPPRGLGVLR